MPKFMLLLHESATAMPEFTPAEIQAVIARYKAWRESVAKRGHMAGGEKLRDGVGRVLKSRNGNVVITDGPYTELKEVMGGFFLIEASSFDQAADIARDCPHMDYGTIEIREIEQV